MPVIRARIFCLNSACLAKDFATAAFSKQQHSSAIIDCEPIYFSYGGKRWLIELWKGQYALTTGAESAYIEPICPYRSSGVFRDPFSMPPGTRICCLFPLPSPKEEESFSPGPKSTGG